jgi:hypothetical protein
MKLAQIPEAELQICEELGRGSFGIVKRYCMILHVML